MLSDTDPTSSAKSIFNTAPVCNPTSFWTLVLNPFIFVVTV